MKLSIIIPAYNTERYIKRCVDSCLAISGIEKEIIIINDGSTDNTFNILNKNYYSVKDIYIVNTDNRGLSEARNLGLVRATGDYIVFLDSDDWIESKIAEILLDKKLSVADVVYYAAQSIVEEEGNKIYQQNPYPIEEYRLYTSDEVFELNNKYRDDDRMLHHAWRGIYNRVFLLNNHISFIPGILYEDNAFWFEVIRNATKIIYELSES